MKLTCKIMRVVQANKKSKHVFFWNSTVGTWNIRCPLGCWALQFREFPHIGMRFWTGTIELICLPKRKTGQYVKVQNKRSQTNWSSYLKTRFTMSPRRPASAGGLAFTCSSCHVTLLHPWGQGDNEFYMRSAEAHKTHYQLVQGCNNVSIVRKIIKIIITMIFWL